MKTASDVACSHSMSAVSDCKFTSLGLMFFIFFLVLCGRAARALPPSFSRFSNPRSSVRQPEFYPTLISLSAASAPQLRGYVLPRHEVAHRGGGWQSIVEADALPGWRAPRQSQFFGP